MAGAAVDELQRGQRERSGLAGAGGGLTEQVLAGHQVGDGLALDGGGLFVTEVVERLEQFGPQTERGEAVLGGDELVVLGGAVVVVVAVIVAVVLLFHVSTLVKVLLHDTAHSG